MTIREPSPILVGMNQRRWIAAMMTAATLLGGAIVVAQPAPDVAAPTTAPTTQQSEYERLLGADADRPERPILPKGRPTIDTTTGTNAIAPNAPQIQTRREGSYIVNQTGRLTKAADGEGFEFVFNADGNAMQDPPMKVLPNLKLGVMQDSIEAGNRDLLFRVTGMVTEYRGRNYILLEKVVVVSDLK